MSFGDGEREGEDCGGVDVDGCSGVESDSGGDSRKEDGIGVGEDAGRKRGKNRSVRRVANFEVLEGRRGKERKKNQR